MSEGLTFGCVTKELVDSVWPDVERLLGKSVATAEGKFDLESIYTSVLTDKLVLWLVLDGSEPIAAITTRVIEYPCRRAMALDWVGGSRMKEWLDIAMPVVAEHAKRNNCKHLEGYGRMAWGRLLKKHNWRPEYVAYRMELTDG